MLNASRRKQTARRGRGRGGSREAITGRHTSNVDIDDSSSQIQQQPEISTTSSTTSRRAKQTARYSGPPRGGGGGRSASSRADTEISRDTPSQMQQQPEISTTLSTTSRRTKQTARYSGPPRGGGGGRSASSRADTEISRDAPSAALAMASYIPYCEDLYNFSQVCFFTDKNAWDPSNIMRPGLLGVSFGLAFEARDAHLQTITTLPALCNALTMVSVVDSSLLTDAGINDLVTNCPNLKFLSFSGAGKLTNASFYVALTKLLKLELLRITGRSPFKSVSHSGKLKTKGSITLLRKRESDPSKYIARDLKKLDLTGQDGMSLAACRKLSGEREGLEVVVGSTGASVYTYWKGEIVKVESNPGFRRYIGGPESGIEEESESDDDGEEEEYSDPEDETYDAMLSDLWSGGYLDPETGVLMPPNGMYWE